MQLALRRRVEETEVGGAVAHHELVVVVRHAPAFAGIAELADGVEAVEVEHVADLRLPRQADQLVAPGGDALAEELLRQVRAFDDLPRLQLDLAHRRMAVQPGAFVQVAVQVEQALGERVEVVRRGVHDLVAIDRDRPRSARRGAGADAGARSRAEATRRRAGSRARPPGLQLLVFDSYSVRSCRCPCHHEVPPCAYRLRCERLLAAGGRRRIRRVLAGDG